jgi:hypothetical protein
VLANTAVEVNDSAALNLRLAPVEKVPEIGRE